MQLCEYALDLRIPKQNIVMPVRAKCLGVVVRDVPYIIVMEPMDSPPCRDRVFHTIQVGERVPAQSTLIGFFVSGEKTFAVYEHKIPHRKIARRTKGKKPSSP